MHTNRDESAYYSFKNRKSALGKIFGGGGTLKYLFIFIILFGLSINCTERRETSNKVPKNEIDSIVFQLSKDVNGLKVINCLYIDNHFILKNLNLKDSLTLIFEYIDSFYKDTYNFYRNSEEAKFNNNLKDGMVQLEKIIYKSTRTELLDCNTYALLLYIISSIQEDKKFDRIQKEVLLNKLTKLEGVLMYKIYGLGFSLRKYIDACNISILLNSQTNIWIRYKVNDIIKERVYFVNRKINYKNSKKDDSFQLFSEL